MAASRSGPRARIRLRPRLPDYVERETIHVGKGSADLVASAAYDYGAGVMTAATNFNGHATTFQYDTFWRLVGVVKPGDSARLADCSFDTRVRPFGPAMEFSLPTTKSGNQTTTYRDAAGRTQGSSSESAGRTTFCDAGGRTQSTAQTTGSSTTVRDASGRTMGTSSISGKQTQGTTGTGGR